MNEAYERIRQGGQEKRNQALTQSVQNPNFKFNDKALMAAEQDALKLRKMSYI